MFIYIDILNRYEFVSKFSLGWLHGKRIHFVAFLANKYFWLVKWEQILFLQGTAHVPFRSLSFCLQSRDAVSGTAMTGHLEWHAKRTVMTEGMSAKIEEICFSVTIRKPSHVYTEGLSSYLSACSSPNSLSTD